eukprot:TRINITY_DN14103_c0_g3_i1.p1 TRINITY_DN14103_c0_g3~~TRINITY_DN14103_c0_g3_i1.p1  ORF type:complete len:113 (-),score=19.72 TRINITY_DN14103_c0_g3_i1:87-425(-)
MDSCIMGKMAYIIPRLVIGVIIQVLCSYSTLPLYALVTQMGSTFKRAIFQEHVQQGLSVWHAKARMKVKKPENKSGDSSRASVQMSSLHNVPQANCSSEPDTKVLMPPEEGT